MQKDKQQAAAKKKSLTVLEKMEAAYSNARYAKSGKVWAETVNQLATLLAKVDASRAERSLKAAVRYKGMRFFWAACREAERTNDLPRFVYHQTRVINRYGVDPNKLINRQGY